MRTSTNSYVKAITNVIQNNNSGAGTGKWEEKIGRGPTCHPGTSNENWKGKTEGEEETREESEARTNENSRKG